MYGLPSGKVQEVRSIMSREVCPYLSPEDDHFLPVILNPRPGSRSNLRSVHLGQKSYDQEGVFTGLKLYFLGHINC